MEGPMVGHEYASEVRPGLSHSELRFAENIPRDSAWTSNPPFYPVFAEFDEPGKDVMMGTGTLLRALLPFATAEARQGISSYSGNTLIVDVKVTCHTPSATDLYTDSTYGHINGTVTPFDDSIQYQVSCLHGDTTIYQLNQGVNMPSGLLKSQFETSTAPGAVLLVTIEDLGGRDTGDWLHRPTKNMSLFICYAPRDAAILNVNLIIDANRTEPKLEYGRSMERYKTSAVVQHFLPTGNSTIRQMMTMEKPRSLLGDLPPRYRRSVVQSDTGGQFALAKGGSGPLS